MESLYGIKYKVVLWKYNSDHKVFSDKSVADVDAKS